MPVCFFGCALAADSSLTSELKKQKFQDIESLYHEQHNGKDIDENRKSIVNYGKTKTNPSESSSLSSASWCCLCFSATCCSRFLSLTLSRIPAWPTSVSRSSSRLKTRGLANISAPRTSSGSGEWGCERTEMKTKEETRNGGNSRHNDNVPHADPF